MLTDPAREIFQLCSRLMGPSAEAGEVVLAQQMGVEPSSASFLIAIGAINQRIERLMLLCEQSELDAEDKFQIVQQLTLMQQAFFPMGLRQPWRDAPSRALHDSRLMPLKLLSAAIRRQHPRPDPAPDAVRDAICMLDALSKCLHDASLEEHDHVRRALVSSVDQFGHRLNKLFWLGWENTLRPLREAFGMIFALEHLMRLSVGAKASARLHEQMVEQLLQVCDRLGVVALAGSPSLLDTFRVASDIVDYKSLSLPSLADAQS